MVVFLIAFAISLGTAYLLIPVVRTYSFRWGLIALPRSDRWHNRPTAILGGAAIFLAVTIGLSGAVIILLTQTESGSLASRVDIIGAQISQWGFLLGSVFIFFLGLYDDFRPLSPSAKLIGQVIAATIVISLGFTTQFFTPRVDNALVAQLPNIFLTYLWLIGITNAINLLDNMDGLAGGIGLITAIFLSVLLFRIDNYSLILISVCLTGSLLGFLYYNFPPASVFMGDSGSMFIGFTLASLAIARQPEASNVFAIMGVPTLLFLLPILDTALVAVSRIMRGESPASGGRDHTSHRLLAIGFSERQAVVGLYWVAVTAGVAAVAIESSGYWLSLIFVPILVIFLTLAAAYLGMLKISTPLEQDNPETANRTDKSTIKQKIIRLLNSSTGFSARHGFFEVILDFFLVNLALYLAFIFQYGAVLSSSEYTWYLRAVPIALLGTYISYAYFGVYRGVWRYVGIEDFLHFVEAAAGSVLLTGMGVYLMYAVGYRSDAVAFQVAYPPVLFILFGFLLFLGLAISRSSFKIFDSLLGPKAHTNDKKVLVYGAGDGSDMAIRWIMMNPHLQYRLVGIIDNDPFRKGRYIHGVEILGGIDRLDELLNSQFAIGVIIALAEIGNQPSISISGKKDSTSLGDENIDKLVKICRNHGCWVRRLRLDFTLLEP